MEEGPAPDAGTIAAKACLDVLQGAQVLFHFYKAGIINVLRNVERTGQAGRQLDMLRSLAAELEEAITAATSLDIPSSWKDHAASSTAEATAGGDTRAPSNKRRHGETSDISRGDLVGGVSQSTAASQTAASSARVHVLKSSDLLKQVVGFLVGAGDRQANYQQLAKLSTVSRLWKTVAFDEQIWQRVVELSIPRLVDREAEVTYRMLAQHGGSYRKLAMSHEEVLRRRTRVVVTTKQAWACELFVLFDVRDYHDEFSLMSAEYYFGVVRNLGSHTELRPHGYMRGHCPTFTAAARSKVYGQAFADMKSYIEAVEDLRMRVVVGDTLGRRCVNVCSNWAVTLPHEIEWAEGGVGIQVKSPPIGLQSVAYGPTSFHARMVFTMDIVDNGTKGDTSGVGQAMAKWQVRLDSFRLELHDPHADEPSPRIRDVGRFIHGVLGL